MYDVEKQVTVFHYCKLFHPSLILECELNGLRGVPILNVIARIVGQSKNALAYHV